MLRIDILTAFPEMFAADAPAALGVSIPARARKAGVVEWHATDIRSFATDKHQKTDDRPFGGGPGMVMTCQPLWDAVHAVEAADPAARPATRILLTPRAAPSPSPSSRTSPPGPDSSSSPATTRASMSGSSRSSPPWKSASATTSSPAASWPLWS